MDKSIVSPFLTHGV